MKGTALIPVLLLALLAPGGCGKGANLSEDQASAVLGEAEAKHLSMGIHADAQVEVQEGDAARKTCPASIAILNDGRVVILIKTSVGWKNNYEGYVISNRPIPANEMTTDSYGRRQIDIPGIDPCLPIVDAAISDRVYRVFFDLN